MPLTLTGAAAPVATDVASLAGIPSTDADTVRPEQSAPDRCDLFDRHLDSALVDSVAGTETVTPAVPTETTPVACDEAVDTPRAKSQRPDCEDRDDSDDGSPLVTSLMPWPAQMPSPLQDVTETQEKPRTNAGGNHEELAAAVDTCSVEPTKAEPGGPSTVARATAAENAGERSAPDAPAGSTREPADGSESGRSTSGVAAGASEAPGPSAAHVFRNSERGKRPADNLRDPADIPTIDADAQKTNQPLTSISHESVDRSQPSPTLPVASAHATATPTAVAVPVAPTTGPAEVSAPLAVEKGDRPHLDVPDPELPGRLVQSMRMQLLRGGGDAIVQIRPEHLGPVTVAVRVEHGMVSAQIVAADPTVVGWLQAHQHSLREGLQSSGLTLDRLVVDQDRKDSDRKDRRREAPPKPRYQDRADRQSTFELTI